MLYVLHPHSHSSHDSHWDPCFITCTCLFHLSFRVPGLLAVCGEKKKMFWIKETVTSLIGFSIQGLKRKIQGITKKVTGWIANSHLPSERAVTGQGLKDLLSSFPFSSKSDLYANILNTWEQTDPFRRINPSASFCK